MRHMRIAFTIACTAAVLVSCGPNKRVHAASIALVKRLQNVPDVQTQGLTPFRATAPATHRDLDYAAFPKVMYLDATESMRGYVGCAARRSKYDQVLLAVANRLGTARITLFGTERGADTASFTPTNFTRLLSCDSVYSRKANPDSVLFDRIAKDRADRVSLYFTDGVQSTDAQLTISPAARQLAQWVRGGGSIAILMYRTDFNGKVWSERLGHFLGRDSLSDRPLYLFVLSRSEGALDYVLSALRDVAPADLALRIAPTSVGCKLTPHVAIYAAEPRLNWLFVDPGVWNQLRTSSPRGPLELGSFACRVAPEYPVGSVRATVAATTRTWNAGTRSFGDESPTAHVVFRAGSRPSVQKSRVDRTLSWPLSVESVASASTYYSLFALRITPILRDPDPDWVSLSTDDDGSLQRANRTYRLDPLIRLLVEADVRRRNISIPYYFTVKEF